MTPVEFLTARYDEAEAEPRDCEDVIADVIDDNEPSGAPMPLGQIAHAVAEALPILRRALADIAAKRAIIARHFQRDGAEDWMDADWLADMTPEEIGGYCGWCTYDNRTVAFPCPDVRDLTQPFADHPDYDQTWRP